MMKTIKRMLGEEKGFTLIELLAVMAIVITLAGIVAASTSGTGESGKTAAVREGARVLTSSIGDYFADQTGQDKLTASTVSVTALFDGEGAGGVDPTEQIISTRWPEKFITASAGSQATAAYVNEFPTASTTTDGKVIRVSIRGKIDADGNPGTPIGRAELLGQYTAIDFDPLVSGGYTVEAPKSLRQTTEALGVDFHNILWLFRKSTSAGGSGENDARVISIFKLVTLVTTGTTVDLTFVQIH